MNISGQRFDTNFQNYLDYLVEQRLLTRKTRLELRMIWTLRKIGEKSWFWTVWTAKFFLKFEFIPKRYKVFLFFVNSKFHKIIVVEKCSEKRLISIFIFTHTDIISIFILLISKQQIQKIFDLFLLRLRTQFYNRI